MFSGTLKAAFEAPCFQGLFLACGAEGFWHSGFDPVSARRADSLDFCLGCRARASRRGFSCVRFCPGRFLPPLPFCRFGGPVTRARLGSARGCWPHRPKCQPPLTCPSFLRGRRLPRILSRTVWMAASSSKGGRFFWFNATGIELWSLPARARSRFREDREPPSLGSISAK